jgi:predicted Ser/Thr protein kinase
MQDKQVQCATAYTDELQLHSVLGEGGFSMVYNGTWHGSSTAIKVGRVTRRSACLDMFVVCQPRARSASHQRAACSL